MTDNQDLIVKALSSPAFYDDRSAKVVVQKTALSYLFITRKWVYKLKRTDNTVGADFSTFSRRKQACLNEMRRSAVYAPHLVVGLKPVRQLKNGRIKIGGTTGTEIDTVLVMRRLQEDHLLSHLVAAKKRMDVAHLAKSIMTLHNQAKVFHGRGGVPLLEDKIEQIYRGLKGTDVFDTLAVRQWVGNCRLRLKEFSSFITLRQKSGRFRRCHGNLFLSNIGYVNQEFLFFSPIEYDENAECVDVLYDLAALWGDFIVHQKNLLATTFINVYMALTNDLQGMTLMRFYASLRLAERALRLKDTLYFQTALQLLSDSPLGLLLTDETRPSLLYAQATQRGPDTIILRDKVIKTQIMGLPHVGVHHFGKKDPVAPIVADILAQQALMLAPAVPLVISAKSGMSRLFDGLKNFVKEKNIPVEFLKHPKKKKEV